ncbi:hypothetical protein [Methylobacterium sp. Leaf93]|uniref:hypothetical protein n=1 Tax=Methylobacterium sp. Leaf93 TaxID=1736249 RepID=UPI0012E71155|nr:hypothetical protein [Methylobacterium sp. Leaf93]
MMRFAGRRGMSWTLDMPDGLPGPCQPDLSIKHLTKNTYFSRWRFPYTGWEPLSLPTRQLLPGRLRMINHRRRILLGETIVVPMREATP